MPRLQRAQGDLRGGRRLSARAGVPASTGEDAMEGDHMTEYRYIEAIVMRTELASPRQSQQVQRPNERHDNLNPEHLTTTSWQQRGMRCDVDDSHLERKRERRREDSRATRNHRTSFNFKRTNVSEEPRPARARARPGPYRDRSPRHEHEPDRHHTGHGNDARQSRHVLHAPYYTRSASSHLSSPPRPSLVARRVI